MALAVNYLWITFIVCGY